MNSIKSNIIREKDNEKFTNLTSHITETNESNSNRTNGSAPVAPDSDDLTPGNSAESLLPEDLEDSIKNSNSAHDASRICIDYVINKFQETHGSGDELSLDEFNVTVDATYNLCCVAIKFLNNIAGSNWKLPENLTKKQVEKLADAIPVHYSMDFSKVIKDITAKKIAEFKQRFPDMVMQVATDYIKNTSENRLLDTLVEDILRDISEQIRKHNIVAKTYQKWPGLPTLTNSQIAHIINELYIVRSIVTCDTINSSYDNTLLSFYINDPVDKDYGIYKDANVILKGIIKSLNDSATKRDMDEVKFQLQSIAPKVKPEDDRNLIAVGNGIFDYHSKTLFPFNPDFVFISKSPIPYEENPVNPVLRYLPDGTDTGEYWDVESWMKTLSDDPEIIDLLWKIIGAIIRPNTRWNKSAWLYSETGNSGKGTLCELMRQICGPGSHASIGLSDFGKEFYLEQLLHVSAIIVDENDVGTFIDKAANLKAVITNDVIVVNRKLEKVITYQFRGFMVQCLNEFPRFKDKSESFYRRQIFIPMTKCFTGNEKKYIKEVFLHDPKVLKYVLHKVLNMDYYELEAPEACKMLLDEYKTYNDPVRDFYDKFKDKFVWDRLPFDFLYDLYCAWMRSDNPNGSIISKKQFSREIKIIVSTDDMWMIPNNQQGNFRITDKERITGEPLSFEYNLTAWLSPHYSGFDPVRRSVASFKDTPYRGIIRRGVCDNIISVDSTVVKSA